MRIRILSVIWLALGVWLIFAAGFGVTAASQQDAPRDAQRLQNATGTYTPTARATFGPARNADWQPKIVSVTFKAIPVQMVIVPAGCFTMGPRIAERLKHTVCIEKSFLLDRYEVSNAQFEQFSGRAAQRTAHAGAEYPRTLVSWVEVNRYCRSRGGRLPTEAEWEYAAKGPDGLIRPAGDYQWDAGVNSFTIGRAEHPAKVSEIPSDVSWVGAEQMGGNVYEWVSSRDFPFPYDAADGREADTDDPREKRLYRGVSYLTPRSYTTLDWRFGLSAVDSRADLGIRCALDLPSTDVAALPPAAFTPTPAPTQAPTGFIRRNQDWSPQVEVVDGVEMVVVPPGCYLMGSSSEQVRHVLTAYTSEAPQHQVCFDRPFLLDRYEVSNAQLAAFQFSVSRQASTADDPNAPRDNVRLPEAAAFCQLRGGRLPTEEEWEYAARGPDSLIYIWGNTPDSSILSACVDHKPQMTSIGSNASDVSWVGAFDLGGNAGEHVHDIFYPYALYQVPLNPNASTSRRLIYIMRGLACGEDRGRTAYRGMTVDDSARVGLGFRCMREIAPK